MISPWTFDLRGGSNVWVTVYECGVPVWKRGIAVHELPGYKWRVVVDGVQRDVHHHDLRSVSYGMRNLS